MRHAAVIALVLLAGCFHAAPSQAGPGVFTDLATFEPVGLAPATAAGGGAALLDANGDERVDAVLTGPEGARLVLDLAGARTAAPLPCACRALAAHPADADNDGDPDVLLVTDAEPVLLRNDGALFSRATALAGWPLRAVAAAWLDVDSDGLLDVVFARPGAPPSASRNGNGSFAPFADDPLPAGLAAARALGLVDLDSDGRLDVLVAGDGGIVALRNANGTFAVAAGYASPLRAASLAVGDVDRSGTQDVVVAGEAGVTALLNSRGRLRAANVTTEPAASAQLLDRDLDGSLDLVVARATGGLTLFLGEGDGTFGPVAAAGLPATGAFRGLAVGDLDGDGPEDLLAARLDGPAVALRNTGPHGHWLKVALQGVASNRDGLGARLVATGNTTFAERYALPGSGLATGAREVVFGLGPGSLSALRIEWPSGTLQDHALPADANRDRSVLAVETKSVLTWGEC